MTDVHHQFADVVVTDCFDRESGPPGGHPVVLLHGFPPARSRSCNLIPQLADRYRVIAPDHLGFGLSDAPSVNDFDYTFDALADLTSLLLADLGVERYAIYVHDYGAPVGWRLALASPGVGQCDHYPERQRLRSRFRAGLLETGVGREPRYGAERGHRGSSAPKP